MTESYDIWVRRCRVTGVTDGDTVRLWIDDGKRRYSEESIRLLDVDAAEIFRGVPVMREIGQQHKALLVEWIRIHDDCADGAVWPYYRRTYKDRQSFNRYVGEIWCVEDHSMNDYMRSVTND